MANPFFEAEERKKKEAEERKKKKENQKEGREEATSPETEPEQVVPAVGTTATEEAASALRQQIDSNMDGVVERKVAVNIMIKPSLKSKMERDIRNKKFKSMSYLITTLLEEYYK